jgi:hypothetical protein
MRRALLLGILASLSAGAAACGNGHGCPPDAPFTPDETATGDVPVDGAADAGPTAPDGGPASCEQVCQGATKSATATVQSCSFGTGVNGAPVAHCTWFTAGHCGLLTRVRTAPPLIVRDLVLRHTPIHG